MVEFEEAQQYSEDNALLFMETSAKTAMNVNEIFLEIGTLVFLLKRKYSWPAFRRRLCRSAQ